jgi:hypothetical protein
MPNVARIQETRMPTPENPVREFVVACDLVDTTMMTNANDVSVADAAAMAIKEHTRECGHCDLSRVREAVAKAATQWTSAIQAIQSEPENEQVIRPRRRASKGGKAYQ